MIFNGNLAQFHPADALMFLSQLGLNGIMSVTFDNTALSLSFKNGMLVDAHSFSGDEKMIRRLLDEQRISETQHQKIVQIQRETGMTARQILDNLNLFPVQQLKPLYEDAIKETLLVFLLLERGEFNFTNVLVDTDQVETSFDVRKITFEMAGQSDEWREFEKTVITLDREIVPTGLHAQVYNQSGIDKRVLILAQKKLTIRQIIKQLPMTSYLGLKAVERLLNEGIIKLGPVQHKQSPTPGIPLDHRVFFSFRRAFKQMIASKETISRLKAIISFCKDYFKYLLVFTARDGVFSQCNLFTIDEKEGLRQKTLRRSYGKIDGEPAFSAVAQSGRGFFGGIFRSDMIRSIIPLPDKGECALLPIQNTPSLSIFLYAAVCKNDDHINPLHYLELLSWLISSAASLSSSHYAMSIKRNTEALPTPHKGETSEPETYGEKIVNIVNSLEELPPLPSVVTQIIDQLSDPNSSMDKLEALIGRDQSLVTKLIKVSNSALYSGVQKCSSLKQALARLGSRTVKSLVLTASTQSYFPRNNSKIGLWGQILWHHSLECGLAAKQIARRVGITDPEEAFIGGIVHDIGKAVIMLKFPEAFIEILKQRNGNCLDEISVEKKVLGYDHVMIGELLMKKWNMPSSIQACVHHHRMSPRTEANQLYASIITFGDYLSHQHGSRSELGKWTCSVDIPQHVQRLGLDSAATEALIDEVKADFRHIDVFE